MNENFCVFPEQKTQAQIINKITAWKKNKKSKDIQNTNKTENENLHRNQNNKIIIHLIDIYCSQLRLVGLILHVETVLMLHFIEFFGGQFLRVLLRKCVFLCVFLTIESGGRNFEAKVFFLPKIETGSTKKLLKLETQLFLWNFHYFYQNNSESRQPTQIIT